jgi:hypothetical protein
MKHRKNGSDDAGRSLNFDDDLLHAVMLDLHRRGFPAAEIEILIGATMAVDVADCWTVLALVRGRHAAVSQRR